MKSQTVHEVRRGLITARIRRIKSRDGIRHTISVHRRFRNGDHWKESALFGPDDLQLVRRVLDHAHTWLLLNSNNFDEQAGPKRKQRSQRRS